MLYDPEFQKYALVVLGAAIIFMVVSMLKK